MPAPGFIVGVVVDKATNKPIRGALIKVGGKRRARTRKDGSFMVMLLPGQKVVKVRRWRYKLARKTIQLQPGKVEVVQFFLERIGNHNNH